MAPGSYLPPEVAAELGHYVYVLRDPRDGLVFYVGKGIGSRVLSHVREAEHGGTRSKIARIRAIHEDGLKVEHLIVRSGLPSEPEAFTVEQAVIDALTATGITLTNAVKGHGSGEHGLATLDAAIARWSAPPAPALPPGSVMFIINRAWRPDMSPAEVYEVTRGHWRIGLRARQQAQAAFGVARGVIRGAYKIDSWFPSPWPTEERRWGFIGHEDASLDAYVGTNVRDRMTDGAQNPVRLFL